MTTITATVDKTNKRTYASTVIAATPDEIFELLADPGSHGSFDGSGMVKDQISGPDRLEMGSKFSMNMKLGGVPYRISNKVVEFDESRLIAWQHLGKHRWRYELEATDDGTLVTETFDWSTSIFPPAIELAGYPERHKTSIEQTLERLTARVEASS